jgi:hypothetical protein
MDLQNTWIALVAFFILVLVSLGNPTVDNSPDLTDGTLGQIPRTVHFTLAVKVTNSDNETYQNVKAVLGGFDEVVFSFKASKKELGDWCSVSPTCKTIDLGTILPGSDAVAVLKFKATDTGSSKAIPIDITSDSFANITKVFSGITVIPYDKDSSFWRVPVSVNTMWTYREKARARITFHKDDIPDPFYQDKVEVRDANYRKISYDATDWEETQYVRKATIVWGLNDTVQQGPVPRKLKFYWIRYPLTDDHSNNKMYGLFLQNKDLPACLSGADDFEAEIDDNDSGWERKHRWEWDPGTGKEDVWEMDFVDADEKSYGEDANWGIDDQSLSVFCGHSIGHCCSPTDLKIERSDRTDNNVTLNETRIGDEHARWVALYTCYGLDDVSWQDWGYRMASNGAGDGAHLLLGFTTLLPIRDTFWEKWADHMVDDGDEYPAKTIEQAWFEACDDAYNETVTARIVFRDSNCRNDYLYGQGSQCTPTFGTPDKWDRACET